MRKMVNEKSTMEFEREYMNKYWKIQRAQWENYFEGKDNDLSEIDEEIYGIVSKFYSQIRLKDRRSKIASLLITKDLVDKSPMVSQLRNKLDNPHNYNQGITENVKVDRYRYKLALSKNMKSDVIKLIHERNNLSKKAGFNSYPDLVFSVEEIDKVKLIETLNRYLEQNLCRAKELIKKYNLSWETWFSDLSRIGCTENQYDSMELTYQMLETFGFKEVKNCSSISFVEKGYTGVAIEAGPGDVRIAVEPIKSLNGIRTLFHENGHAVAYCLNKESGLYKILPPSFDEAMAVVMECISSNILIKDKADALKIFEIITLEYTRCAISALYELEMWQNPEGAEELYIKYYGMMDMEIADPSIWSSDTFRSIDPVYIHNYVIGAILAERLFTYLKDLYSNDYTAWGNWIKNNVYMDGRKSALKDKIKILGKFL